MRVFRGAMKTATVNIPGRGAYTVEKHESVQSFTCEICEKPKTAKTLVKFQPIRVLAKTSTIEAKPITMCNGCYGQTTSMGVAKT